MRVLKVPQFTLIFAGHKTYTLKKYCGPLACTTEEAAIESVRLGRLVRVAQRPLRRRAQLEAIGPIG